MFGLVAAITTGAWSLFTEGAILGATAYAVGKGIISQRTYVFLCIRPFFISLI